MFNEESQQNKFNPEQLKFFQELVNKCNTLPHNAEELEKVVGKFTCEDLDDRLALISNMEFDPYSWQEITEYSYANQMKKQFDKFAARYGVIFINF